MAENIKLKDLVGNERSYNNIKVIKIPKATEVSVEQEGEVEYAEYIQPDLYDGGFTVTPGADQVTLKTAETYLKQNVVIEPIPYTVVTNLAGGKTVTIGQGEVK